MAALTEGRVREMINERFNTFETQLADLMNTADFSARQIQQEALETRTALEDSNERPQAIYNEVQSARG